MNRVEAHRALKACLSQYEAAWSALAHFEVLVRADPSLLFGRPFAERDLADSMRELESTYLLRLYAHFEGSVRDYWAAGLGKRTRPPMESLLNRVAARRGVPYDVLERSHAVRSHRNHVAHPSSALQTPVAIREAASYLGRYLSHLPLAW